ncbi:hypothetical protein L901_24165 [Agrobacterium sp. D14]|nr:hypothetical protein L901_24165 [Agrobacterium sp. D14]
MNDGRRGNAPAILFSRRLKKAIGLSKDAAQRRRVICFFQPLPDFPHRDVLLG